MLSPLLFNIAFLGLPAQLEQIPNLHHVLYADDITLWTDTDSLGGLQDTLQLAADTVNRYAQACGLHCSPQKSELIVRKHPPRNHVEPIAITLDGHSIPPSHSPKILGLTIQANARNDLVISKLRNMTDQVVHMIRRDTSWHRGMK